MEIAADCGAPDVWVIWSWVGLHIYLELNIMLLLTTLILLHVSGQLTLQFW